MVLTRTVSYRGKYLRRNCLQVAMVSPRTHLQEPVGLTREELKVGSAGEIAGPVGVLAVRVGKKIVVVFRPPKIAFPKSFEVTRRSGIQEIHSAAVALLRRAT